jgi:hypothetical protein
MESTTMRKTDNKRYLTSVQLRDRYGGRSEMWVERIMQRDAKFPRHIYIGRLRFWALDEIEAYERAAVAAAANTEAASSWNCSSRGCSSAPSPRAAGGLHRPAKSLPETGGRNG